MAFEMPAEASAEIALDVPWGRKCPTQRIYRSLRVHPTVAGAILERVWQAISDPSGKDN